MAFKTMPHLTHDITCATCKHFYPGLKMRAVPHQGQWIPLKDLLTQGVNTKDLDIRDISACTHGPGLWPTVDSEHWCGQYESTPTR